MTAANMNATLLEILIENSAFFSETRVSRDCHAAVQKVLRLRMRKKQCLPFLLVPSDSWVHGSSRELVKRFCAHTPLWVISSG